MAKSIRKLDGLIPSALHAELQKIRGDILQVAAGTVSHADASAAIATANATDLPTSIVLTNAIKVAYNAHLASACDTTSGQGVHRAADATNPTAVANATDLASVQTLLNDLKSKYNSHRALASAHGAVDATNVSAAAAATDQGTSNTLANDLKTQMNAHFARALNHSAIALVAP